MPVLSEAQRKAKLKHLAEIEGKSIDELLQNAVADSVCMGICAHEGCDYTCEVEPDQDRGWSECGHGNSVVSALILSGLI